MAKYYVINDDATTKYGALKYELFTPAEVKKYGYDENDFHEAEVSKGRIGYYGKHRLEAKKQVIITE